MSGILNFETHRLFGPTVIGTMYKNKECSVAVVYDFKGNLIDCQAFDKEGLIIEEKIKED